MCSVFRPIFFVEFLVELDVTSTGCVALRCVAFCCLLRIALCYVVLRCDVF